MCHPFSRVRSRSALVLGVVAAAVGWSAVATAQVGPEESAKLLKPADELEAKLWASEPMVINPTTMDIDSRGRVWITEGLNYRLTRGGNRRFPKLEEADRIKILEDTDGDGKADKVTVFADRIFPVPMGIAVEERYSKEGKYQGCKVYVGNSPDILVLEDTDGDDKADKRSPLLTGFGGIDSDHGVHGMVFGPDGKLYFTHGDGCCSVQQDHSERAQNFDVVDKSGRHVSSSELGNTLRVNRDGTQLEILADRQRNPYETCVNSFGNVFTSDNDDDGNRGSRVIWIMDGGKYGYHTQGSPRHWGEDVPGMVPKLVGTGNGSPCGVMVYEGNLLPKEYFGCILEAEAGPRQVNYFPLTRNGAAFRTDYKVLLSSDDPWFRPVDVTAAPDGSVFVADWYDAGVGGHAFSDQTTGRIYRVAPKGAKSKRVKADFGSMEGLLAALKSPVVATRDTARRLLIDRGGAPSAALRDLLKTGEPAVRARVLWVLHAVAGEDIAAAARRQDDARLRELAVRILGRDVSRVGKVELTKPEGLAPLAAERNLGSLLQMAKDSDAGVRRELILALRDLPTAQVGAALRTLAGSWDGQDRWYLEALGLALRDREGSFLVELFDGNLYGALNLAEKGSVGGVALPPYFPVDRNEAFIASGEKDLPANALTKTLGLAWMVHRAEVLPLLTRIMPNLKTPELQQASDDVVAQITDPAAGVSLAELTLKMTDPVRRRQALATLGGKLGGAWRPAGSNPTVIRAIESALADPRSRAEAIQTVAATRDGRYAAALVNYTRDAKAPVEVQVAAVEALAPLQGPMAEATLLELIAKAKGFNSSNPVAEAAVRTLARVVPDSRGRMRELVVAADVPLGLRREALRCLAQQGREGGLRVISMAKEGKLPADLKTEATTVLNTHPDRSVRDEAAHVLPLPKTAGGKPLPPFFELIRRDGDAEKGRAVFFRSGVANACGACHRVQGSGQWIGPDLSTIGAKYGKDELLRSILNPSASIPFSFRSTILGLADGRVLTGLPVEETPDRLVLKTADGTRISLRSAEIESRAVSETSLMPEGLAETMGEQDLIDVLAFLSTLKTPVSIVGQFQALGPVSDGDGKAPFDLKRALDPNATIKGAGGQTFSWRRITANAEGLVDLVPLVGTEPANAVYLHAPVVSPSEQQARLVLDTRADVRVWLAGKALSLPEPSGDAPRSLVVTLPKGTTELVIRLPGGEVASLVATFVAPRPLEFSPSEAR